MKPLERRAGEADGELGMHSYLAKPRFAKSESAVQETYKTDKPYFA